jgi:uncharacterized protein (TIGR00369 family)
MNLLQLVAEAREARDPARLADAIPYSGFMGIAPEIRTGELLTRMKFQARNIGNPHLPAIHGGAIGGLLEMAGIFHLLWESETVTLPKIVNITVDYLRSARPLDTIARGNVTKQGRRVVTVSVDAWQDDRAKPVAHALMHFLVTPRE